MSSKNLGDPENENSSNKLLDSIKSISSAILSLGFVLYAIGFVIINLRLSKFGAHEIGLLEPRYLISGLLALFFVLVPLLASLLITVSFTSKQLEDIKDHRIIRIGDPILLKKVKDEVSEFEQKYSPGNPVEYAELKKVLLEILRGLLKYIIGLLKNLIIFSILLTISYIIAFSFALVLFLPSYEEAGISVTEVNWATIRDVVLLQLVCLVFLFLRLINEPFKTVYELLKDRILMVSLIGLASIILFANGIYSEIPFFLGGGKPEQICLGLADKASAPIFGELGITVGSEDFWTKPVDLIFDGENTVTILLEKDSSASINKDLIASVRYKCVDSNAP
jgi:hypothetical protein